MTMTRTGHYSGTDDVSGLRISQQRWEGEETEIGIDAIEGDGVTMQINATVHDEAGLDALIAELQARRNDLIAARTLADSAK